MNIEEQLKQEILSRYKSIREFSSMTAIPYSTVDSVLRRGIKNSGVGTVIKIFSFLDIDVESITSGKLKRIEQTNISPSTAEAAPEEETVTMEEVTSLLTSLGFIKEGRQLSDDDFAFLTHLIGLLDAWFRERA